MANTVYQITLDPQPTQTKSKKEKRKKPVLPCFSYLQISEQKLIIYQTKNGRSTGYEYDDKTSNQFIPLERIWFVGLSSGDEATKDKILLLMRKSQPRLLQIKPLDWSMKDEILYKIKQQASRTGIDLKDSASFHLGTLTKIGKKKNIWSCCKSSRDDPGCVYALYPPSLYPTGSASGDISSISANSSLADSYPDIKFYPKYGNGYSFTNKEEQHNKFDEVHCREDITNRPKQDLTVSVTSSDEREKLNSDAKSSTLANGFVKHSHHSFFLKEHTSSVQQYPGSSYRVNNPEIKSLDSQSILPHTLSAEFSEKYKSGISDLFLGGLHHTSDYFSGDILKCQDLGSYESTISHAESDPNFQQSNRTIEGNGLEAVVAKDDAHEFQIVDKKSRCRPTDEISLAHVNSPSKECETFEEHEISTVPCGSGISSTENECGDHRLAPNNVSVKMAATSSVNKSKHVLDLANETVTSAEERVASDRIISSNCTEKAAESDTDEISLAQENSFSQNSLSERRAIKEQKISTLPCANGISSTSDILAEQATEPDDQCESLIATNFELSPLGTSCERRDILVDVNDNNCNRIDKESNINCIRKKVRSQSKKKKVNSKSLNGGDCVISVSGGIYVRLSKNIRNYLEGRRKKKVQSYLRRNYKRCCGYILCLVIVLVFGNVICSPVCDFVSSMHVRISSTVLGISEILLNSEPLKFISHKISTLISISMMESLLTTFRRLLDYIILGYFHNKWLERQGRRLEERQSHHYSEVERQIKIIADRFERQKNNEKVIYNSPTYNNCTINKQTRQAGANEITNNLHGGVGNFGSDNNLTLSGSRMGSEDKGFLDSTEEFSRGTNEENVEIVEQS